jgi:type IV secretion system protein TrbL
MVLLTVDLSSVSDALTTMVKGLESTHDKLAMAGQAIMQKLGLIEVAVALLWCMFQGASIKSLLQKALTLAVWMTIVANFHELAKSATKWLVTNAANVSGGGDPWELVLNPGKIMELGTNASEPLMEKAADVSLLSTGDTLMIAICAMLLVGAYIFLSIHVAFTVIEFYLYMNVGALLIPFAVLSHTRFVADKAINAVLNAGIKLAVVTYIMMAIKPILESVTLRQGFGDRTADLTWNEIFAMLLVSMLCLFVAVAAPRMAAGLLHGSPSLSGTGVVLGATAGAIAAAQIAGRGAYQLGKGLFSAADSGFSAIGQRIPPAAARPPSPGGGGSASAPAAPPPRPVSVGFAYVVGQARLAPPRPASAPALDASSGGSPRLGQGGPFLLGPGSNPSSPTPGDA